MSVNPVNNTRHQALFTPTLDTIIEVEEPEEVQEENNELKSPQTPEEGIKSNPNNSEHILRDWLNEISDANTLYGYFMDAFKKNSSLCLDLLEAPIIDKMLVFSNESGPTIYFLLLNAIRYDQKEFVVELAEKFLISEEFITDTLQSDEQQPKLILFICAIILKKEETLSKLLKSEKFKEEKFDIEDLKICLKFLSKYCEDLSLVLNSGIMKLISFEDFIDMLFINIFNSHLYSVFLMLNSSSFTIPEDMLCNFYFYALDLPVEKLLTIFESQFNEIIEKKRKGLNDFLQKATNEQLEEKFSEAVENGNIWIIHELLLFPNMVLSPKILADALIKIASTSPKCKFTLNFVTHFFSQTLKFTKNIKIPNGKDGWGGALIQASKNGHEKIVNIILDLPIAPEIPLNDCLFPATTQATENEHQEIATAIEKFIHDK